MGLDRGGCEVLAGSMGLCRGGYRVLAALLMLLAWSLFQAGSTGSRSLSLGLEWSLVGCVRFARNSVRWFHWLSKPRAGRSAVVVC